MKQDEQDQVSRGLSDIIERLKSLSREPINAFPQWPDISRTIGLAHSMFLIAIQRFIDPCESYITYISESPYSFNIWQKFLSDLWTRVDYLRNLHNRLFHNDYTQLIYHHILIDEMFGCLVESLRRAKIRFLLLPSGELQEQSLNHELTYLAPGWFQQNFIAAFQNIIDEEPIEYFECLWEKDFEFQYVLAHEVFHAIIRYNGQLKEKLDEVALQADAKIKDCLSGPQESWFGHFEELFCDFAAAYYFGPRYMKSFANEIRYYMVQGSSTHPPADLRAKFLLATNADVKDCIGYKSVESYLHLRKQSSALPDKPCLKKLGDQFADALKAIGLHKFTFIDQVKIVNDSFKHNIPFVVSDVRILVNNLPPTDSAPTIERYCDLVAESLRKTNLLRQAKKYVREPDKLFAIPGALSKKS